MTFGAARPSGPWWLALVVLLAACTGEDTPTVETLGVERAQVRQTISAPGRLEAADRQAVTATVPGVVARIRAEDGEQVEAGDVVVRLASDEVELALEQAEAAEAALASSQGGVHVEPPGAAAIAAADDAVARLDADVKPDLAAARRKARRAEPDQRKAAQTTVALLEEAYHDVRHALLATGRSAAAQQNAVAASFSSALNQALDQASAGQAAQAAGAADSAAARADDLRLRAPLSGVVALGGEAGTPAAALPDDLAGDAAAGALAGGLPGGTTGEAGRLRVGMPVTPGQTVFTVYDLSEFYVRADVDEIDAPQLQVGQPATVLVDAFPDEEFSGEVVEVAIEAQTSPAGGVAYPVRVRLHDLPSEGPRVGMTASAEITTRTVRSDLTVPSRAVVRRGGGQAVFVVRDGVAVLVPVEVEALGEERAAVRAPQLRADDQVIVSGYEDLTDGAAVTVAP